MEAKHWQETLNEYLSEPTAIDAWFASPYTLKFGRDPGGIIIPAKHNQAQRPRRRQPAGTLFKKWRARDSHQEYLHVPTRQRLRVHTWQTNTQTSGVKTFAIDLAGWTFLIPEMRFHEHSGKGCTKRKCKRKKNIAGRGWSNFNLPTFSPIHSPAGTTWQKGQGPSCVQEACTHVEHFKLNDTKSKLLLV